MSEPTGNAQIALSPHKRSSKSDTHQKQLAKYPNLEHFMLKRSYLSFTPLDWLTYCVLELVSLSRRMFPFHRRKSLTASAEQRRNREDPRSKWFQQPLGTSPQTPLLGTGSHEQRLLTATLVCPHGGDVALENSWEPDVARAPWREPKPRPGVRVPLLVTRCGRADFCPKASSPDWQSQGKSDFSDGGRKRRSPLCLASWNWSQGGLISVVLIALSTVNL